MPGIYAELHPTKNGSVDIEKLTCGSNKRVWWLCQSNGSRPEGCQHDHEWEAKVSGRCRYRRPTGCPFCSETVVCPCKSLAELQPALLQYWDGASNAIPLQDPLDFSRLNVHSKREVWWRHECPDGRLCQWTAAIKDVARRFKVTGRAPYPRCALALQAAPYAERREKLIKHNQQPKAS